MTREELYMQGMELFCQEKLEAAAAALLVALEIDPDYGDALHALAMTYYHQGEIGKAIEYGERLRAAEPDNIHAYTSLSMFYNAKGFIAKAEEMGARAAQLAAEGEGQ